MTSAASAVKPPAGDREMDEVMDALRVLSGNPTYLVITAQTDLISVLLRIANGARATLLMPSPSAVDTAVGSAASLCNGYSMDEVLMYSIVEGRRSFADLLNDAAGTRYPTFLDGKQLVKSSRSNSTHVVIRTPTGAGNATIIQRDVYKSDSMYIHGINNIIVPDQETNL